VYREVRVFLFVIANFAFWEKNYKNARENTLSKKWRVWTNIINNILMGGFFVLSKKKKIKVIAIFQQYLKPDFFCVFAFP